MTTVLFRGNLNIDNYGRCFHKKLALRAPSCRPRERVSPLERWRATACFWHANDVALKRPETREASCMLHTGDVFKRLGSRDAGQLLFWTPGAGTNRPRPQEIIRLRNGFVGSVCVSLNLAHWPFLQTLSITTGATSNIAGGYRASIPVSPHHTSRRIT